MSIYHSRKVKIRFIQNFGNVITASDFTKALLPALWNSAEKNHFIEAIDIIVQQINENKILFFPFAIDEYKTRFLRKLNIAFEVFDWDTNEEDIHKICEYCRVIENVTDKQQPIYTRGSIAIYSCIQCKGIIFDDYDGYHGHGSRGYLTEKELRNKFGVDLPI